MSTRARRSVIAFGVIAIVVAGGWLLGNTKVGALLRYRYGLTPYMRSEAAIQLVTSDRYRNVAIDALESFPEWTVRERILHLLADVYPTEAAKPLARAMLRDPEPFVRAMCASQLGQIGQNALTALPALIDALDDDRPNVNRAALDSLEELTGHKAESPARGAWAIAADCRDEWQSWWLESKDHLVWDESLKRFAVVKGGRANNGAFNRPLDTNATIGR